MNKNKNKGDKKPAGKIGNTPPKSQAKPLGQPKAVKEPVDNPSAVAVGSETLPSSEPVTVADTNVADTVVTESSSAITPQQEKNTVELNLTRQDITRKGTGRKNRLVVFTIDGRQGNVYFAPGLFAKDAVPAALKIEGEGFSDPKAPKVAETKEERKARLAAMPKPTLAEQIAKADAKAAKLRAKLEAEAAKAAEPQPEAVTA